MKLLKMLTSPVKASVIALVSLGAQVLEAGNVQWNGTEGPFDPVEIWPNSKLPVKGDDALLYSSANMGTKTVTMTNDWTTALKRLRFRPADSATFVFDGTGHEFVQPDLDPSESVYTTTPFKFDVAGTYEDFFSVYSAGLTGNAYLGTWRLTDPVFRTYTDGAGGQYAVFSAGTYNFYDPNGTVIGANAASRVRFAQATVAAKTVVRFEGKDTVATFGDFEFMGRSKDNLLEFREGVYTIRGNFASNGAIYDMASGSGAHHAVRVTDGATLTVAGQTLLYLDKNRDSTSADAKYAWDFEISNGATLNTTNAFYAYRSTNGVLRLENATWNAPGTGVNGNLAIGIGYDPEGYYYVTTQKMIAVNSTLNVGTAHNTGNFNVGRVGSATKRSFGSFFATNCIINAKAIFQFATGSSVLKDCTFTGSGNTDYAIVVTEDAELTLDGGTYTKPGGPRLNFSANSKRGPILTLANGTMTTSQIDLGLSYVAPQNCACTNVLRQTGGTLNATYNFMCHQAQPCHTILEGGTYNVQTTTGEGHSRVCEPDKGGWAHFTGNGGTVLVSGIATYLRTRPLFEYLDRCEAGPNGLNVDTNGKNPFMIQDVTDMPGERGRFVKRGVGTLKVSVPSLWDVSETSVEKGTLLVSANGTATAVTMATAMSVGPDATLSLVGDAESLTVDSLAVTNGTLALDPGDVITVKGAFAPRLLKLSFSSDLVEDAPVDCFVFEQPLSREATAALKVALVTSALPEGDEPWFELTTDAQGRTTVTVTAKKVPAVTDETVWEGADAEWGTEANWSDGVPTKTKAALLTDAAATKEIEVTGDRELGALAISGDGFAVGGEGQLEFAAFENSRIDVTEGSHGISAGLLTLAKIPVSVAPDASLIFSGEGLGRGLIKEGKGRMTLDGQGRYSAGTVKANGGRLVVSNAAAFAGATLTLGNGTLEIPETVTIADGGRLAIAATNVANESFGSGWTEGAVVVDNAGDATFTGIDITSGCLVKRGKGTLTLDLSDGTSKYLARGTGDYKAGGAVFYHPDTWLFDEDGTPPTFGYTGLSVMGGELVVKGDGETEVKADTVITVGTHTSSDCGAQPVVTLDNLKLTTTAGYHDIIVGNRAGMGILFAKTPVLRILNGSTLTMGNDLKQSSDYSSDFSPDAHPTIAVTNSTVVVKRYPGYGTDPMIYFSCLRCRRSGVASLFAANAHLETALFVVGGNTDSRITASTLTGVDGAYSKINSDKYRQGRVLFDGSTVLKVNALGLTEYDASYTKNMMTWAFDDATWDFGDGDFAISSANCYLPLNQFEMVGTGLRLAPAAGKTFRTDAVFMGEGGLVKSGEGTLAFSEGTYQFTGPLCALAGTVDLSAAGSITNACFGAGDGVISGATLVNPVFRLDAGAPTLASCTMSGRVRLDVGDEPLVKPYPTDMTVMRFTGTAPNVSNWRLSGAGKKGLGGIFTVQGNEVKVTIDERGMVLVVR